MGAEFLAATGGDMANFGTPDRLRPGASASRLRTSQRQPTSPMALPPRRATCLLHAANISNQTCPEPRTSHDRKRSEGERHIQAVPVLARRRVNVLWALLRD
ncbi:hypothetical protein GCM10010317_082370 [Streptomyces mirabilis]|nr:hypothetical protein GCM10010317_082370 [Streptomyces mirabilis]